MNLRARHDEMDGQKLATECAQRMAPLPDLDVRQVVLVPVLVWVADDEVGLTLDGRLGSVSKRVSADSC